MCSSIFGEKTRTTYLAGLPFMMHAILYFYGMNLCEFCAVFDPSNSIINIIPMINRNSSH